MRLRRGRGQGPPGDDDPGANVGPDRDQVSPPAADGHVKVTKPSWFYAVVRAGANFLTHRAPDLAAALTYYAVLAVGPALIALVSTLALLGRSEQVVARMLSVVGQLAPESTVATLDSVITQIASSSAAGLGLLLGLGGALWSASAYVGAFGRAMNTVFEVEEGRPIWKLRAHVLLVTVIVLALVILVALAVVISGPVALAIGEAVGLEEQTVQLWNTTKWPIVLLLVISVVALLYYATPNVKRPRVRLFSAGAVVAILAWVGASFGFAFYVSRFSSYDATYGSLAGFIVFLLWLWITNVALVFGAELDAELERRRQLIAGIRAEKSLQLDLRDDSGVEKRAQQEAERVAIARIVRKRAQSDEAKQP